MLTMHQKRALIIIREALRETGVSPSYDEIRIELGLASKSGVNGVIDRLEERGFINRIRHKRRALELTAKGWAVPELPGSPESIVMEIAAIDGIEAHLPEHLANQIFYFAGKANESEAA